MVFFPAVGATGCTDGPAPGAVELARLLLERWGDRGAYNLGIYNCRRVAGSTSYSVHAEGRAFDLGIPAAAAPALGDDALNALLAVETPCLQRVIWWGRIYDLSSPAGRPYTGVDPHRSHLHIELPPSAASGLSPAQSVAITGDDDVTPAQLQDALRAVLNEGTGVGQASWAGTSKATLATAQSLHNDLAWLKEAIGSVEGWPPGTQEDGRNMRATARWTAQLLAQTRVVLGRLAEDSGIMMEDLPDPWHPGEG